jgi:hypothetical protein
MVGRYFWGSQRRSASVPADHVRYERTSIPDVGGIHKATVIASMAAEDSDAMATASRRHDRDFLHDISTKLANINAVRAPPSPLPPRQRDPSPNVLSRRPPPPSASPANLRRSLALTPEDDYDIAAYLQRTPSSLPSSVAVRLRASSLPPPQNNFSPLGFTTNTTASGLYPVRPSVPRWFPTTTAYYSAGGGGRWTGRPTVPTGLPPVPKPDRLDAITDGVVGVAHTALYGDIVIGIPYKKRFMFNAQRDLDDMDTQSLPALHIGDNAAVRVLHQAPNFAPTSSSTRRTNYLPIPQATSELSAPYSRASYAGPTGFNHVGTKRYYHPFARQVPPAPSRRSPLLVDDDDLYLQDYDDLVSTKSYPVTGSRRPVPPKARHQKTEDLENDIASSIFGDAYSDRLSTLSKDYKTILNRYMPAKNGPRTAASLPDNELDRKYGQILASMQPRMSSSLSRPPAGTTPYHGYTHTSSLPPPTVAQPMKPVMSETRRKLRDLLCRTRGDPNYFDN